MSIFGIIGISALIAVFALSICGLISVLREPESNTFWIITVIITVIVLICSTLVGIGLTTENERIYVAKYEMQKLTIEQSLDSNMLTGLERVELVNKAIELNGELAERKTSFNLWHHVHYDDGIYDNVDFISFESDNSEITRND